LLFLCVSSTDVCVVWSVLKSASCALSSGQSMTGVMVYCRGISGRQLWYTVGSLVYSFGFIVLIATEIVELTVWVSLCI